MTFRGFRHAQRSDTIKKMVSTSQSRYVAFEHFCARYLSPLYFAAIRSFFAVYYYRSGKAYAYRNKLRTLRRISKGN